MQHQSAATQKTPPETQSNRKRKLADHQATQKNYSGQKANQINGSIRVAAYQTTNSNYGAQIAVNPRLLKSNENLQRQQLYETLLDLYGDNYCACQNSHCKGHLSNKFKALLKTNLSSTLLRELTMIITGTKQKQSAKLFKFFFKFLDQQDLNRDLLDDLLQLFVVLFLKSEESVRVTVLEDLDKVFNLLKRNETKIFVDGNYKYKVFFFGISQFQLCNASMEEGKAQGTDKGQVCSNLERTFHAEAVKRREQELSMRAAHNEMSTNGCRWHGTCDIKADTIDLEGEENLTKFVCFLATLKFKLYHVYDTPDVSLRYKQAQCKVFLNIMFLFLQYGRPKYYHYPLRALAEFFSNQKTACELSKRLNAESLLAYKQQKDIMVDRILDDFSTKLVFNNSSGEKSKRLTIQASEHIFEDVQEKLRNVLNRLESSRNESCFIMCLKIVSQLIHRQMQEVQPRQLSGICSKGRKLNSLSQQTVNLYVACLERVGENLSNLQETDKEVFFSEVKNLVKIIRWNQERYQQEKKLRREIRSLSNKHGLNFHLDNLSDSSDEESNRLLEESKHNVRSKRRDQSASSAMYKHGNAQLTREEYAVFHGHRIRSSRRQNLDSQDRVYPGLDSLMRLLQLSSIQHYPKLSVLVYDALIDIIEVFDNKFVSFFNQCIVHKIIEKGTGTSSTATQSQQDDHMKEETEKKAQKLQKTIRIDTKCTSSREQILNFYMYDYKLNIENLASSKSKIAEQKDGNDLTQTLSEQQKARNKREVERLVAMRKQLSKSEISAIVDFLICLCKYNQVCDKQAVTMGCHLMPDFFNQSKGNLTHVIERCRRDQDANAELLMVNFELRSKHYLSMISQQQKRLLSKVSDVPDQLEDKLFGSLFEAVFKDMQQSEERIDSLDPTGGRKAAQGGGLGSMQIYTSQFMKYLTKILQRGKHYLNVDAINTTVKSLLLSDKLILVANTLPLFTLAQMFIMSDNESKVLTESKEIIVQLYSMIERNILMCKEQLTKPPQPLLFYYKMRNIIAVFTSLLKFHLCRARQTPSSNSNKNPTNFQKTKAIDEPVTSSFVVRKQRRCNFCGYHLDQPSSFTFSVKCQNCSLRNSSVILPTSSMCDSCTDEQVSYIQTSCKLSIQKDSNSYSSSDNSEELQSPMGSASLTEAIWSVITASLDLINSQISNEKNRQTQGFFTNAYSSTMESKSEEEIENIVVASCLSKVDGSTHLHNHLTMYLNLRILKVFQHLINHEIPVHSQALESFKRLEREVPEMGDAFALLKDRVETVGTSIKVQEMQIEMVESQLLGSSAFKPEKTTTTADKVMNEE